MSKIVNYIYLLQRSKHENNTLHVCISMEQMSKIVSKKTDKFDLNWLTAKIYTGENYYFISIYESSRHQVHFDKVKILDRENRYFERGVKEAVYISVHQPSLIVNKDRGRHHLSSVYDPILTSSGQVNINLLTKASNSLRC